MFLSLFTIAKNSLKGQHLRIILGKVRKRFEKNTSVEARKWADDRKITFEEFARELSPALYEEAGNYGQELREYGKAKLEELDLKVGGGGHYELAYFLTRHYQPQTVLETGVAAGFSSQAFLTAIEKNGSGTLYSSDLPYFRMENPEKWIGAIVEEHLKQNWELFIEGDQVSLPKIVSQVEGFDLFHYDSDKYYSGRVFAFDLVKPRLKANSLVVFDDIQDNLHFKDLVEELGVAYRIFEFEGKFVGMFEMPD